MESFRNLIFRVIYNEKKILKSTIKRINFNEIIAACLHPNETNFAIKNRFILGIVKIYVRQYKYLLDESNELLLKMSHKESIRVVKNKNINLKIDNNEFFITDDILQDKELLPCGNDWANFDNISIEAMREGSGLVGSTLIENLVEPLKKKRKIIEDEMTEYDTAFYKKNICNYKNTVDLETRPPFNDMYDFRILDVFIKNILAKQYERLSEVEEMRDQTTIEELDILDGFESSFNDIRSDRSSDENKYSFLLEQSDNFIFNSVVLESDKLMKAKQFLNLLELAGEGKMKCIQETQFSQILCKRIDV